MTRKKENLFERMAAAVTRFSGGTPAFILALGVVLLWLVMGPVFQYSDTWQLVINTGTTIVTFLMVFLIQRAQNKDSRALHLKLNELLASIPGPSNRMVDAENLTERELEVLGRFYHKLAAMVHDEEDLSESHSIEEAQQAHKEKYRGVRRKSGKGRS